MTTYTLYPPPGFPSSQFQSQRGATYNVVGGSVSNVDQRDLADFIRAGFSASAGGGGIATQTVSGAAGTLTLASGQTNVVLANTASGPVSCGLPSASGSKTIVVVKDSTGNAAANNVTVTGSIDGQASSGLTVNYQSVTFVDNGSSWSLI